MRAVALALLLLAPLDAIGNPRRPTAEDCPRICRRIIGCEEGPFTTPEASCQADCVAAIKTATWRTYVCAVDAADCAAVRRCQRR